MLKKGARVLCVLFVGICVTLDSTESVSFFSPLTTEEKNTIRNAVSDCADKTISELMSDLEEVQNIVEQLKSIPPLTALCFIFSDYDLRRNVEVILETEIKSGFFLMQIHSEINKVIERGLLDQYILECVASLGVDGDLMHKYIDEEDYRGLVEYFLQMETESFRQYN